MIEVRQTQEFTHWYEGLRDGRARASIDRRIARLAEGNPGDVRPVGQGVSELRINRGPGYRVYYIQRGAMLVVLLAGGNKDSQSRDIRRALELAREQ